MSKSKCEKEKSTFEDIYNKEYQAYPSKGQLKENMNVCLDKLRQILSEEGGLVYSYVMTTIDPKGDEMIQRGCGPNFQGGVITLCTCKHYMRTWRDVDAWRDVWIAGFTSVNLFDDKKNRLFYLMKVGEGFESHKDMWDSLKGEAEHKNAYQNIFGDVYKPPCNDEGYESPVKGHLHFKNWERDILYENKRNGRQAVLLKGDPNRSYLWSKPIIAYDSGTHPRTKKWKSIREFMSKLG